MSAVIKIVGLMGSAGLPSPFDGKWLVAYDPDRPGRDPLGAPMIATVEVTDDPAKAARFATATEAWAEWTRVSTTNPTRPDGRPNRPLTAFTVEISTVSA
jgi:hypothetical protein